MKFLLLLIVGFLVVWFVYHTFEDYVLNGWEDNTLFILSFATGILIFTFTIKKTDDYIK